MNRSQFRFYKALGLLVAAAVAIAGAVLGRYEGVSDQLVIFYTLATFALILWVWHFFWIQWAYSSMPSGAGTLQVRSENETPSYFGELIRKNRLAVAAILIVAGIFIVLSFSIDGFFSWGRVLGLLAIVAFFALAYALSRFVTINRSAFIGCAVLLALFIVGSFAIEGFASSTNIKSMLLFSAFLGLASIGQTLVALLGGLDLSIPFIIGASNIGLLYLISLGIPAWLAFIAFMLIGIAFGLLNGILSYRLQGQALIVTLGVGFAVSGGTQIVTSIDSSFGGNVFGEVPGWLVNLATVSGSTFGLSISPVILIWIAVAAGLVYGLNNTTYGRNLYALGGSRVAAARLSISERAYWVGCYMISGFFAALTGALLLGWSGGGFIGVGEPYLFTTLAAVVIGGTSLLGGRGGYGFTVIGVLVLQVLTSFLVGIGLSFQAQQFVFGLLILPMVAIYARSPHVRTQI